MPPSETSEAIAPSEPSTDSTAPQLVIWGTDVSVQVCKDKFRRFVNTFIDPTAEEDERTDGYDPNRPLYLQKMEEVRNNFSNFRWQLI